MHKPGGNVGHGGIISAMSRADIAADLKHAQEIAGGTQAFAYPFGDVTDDGQRGRARRRHPLRLHHAKLVGSRGRRHHRAAARAHLRRVFARFVYRPGERIERAGDSQQK